MTLSTPIKDLVDEDDTMDVIEVKEKGKKKGRFNMSWCSCTQLYDAVLITIASLIVLNISLENYSYVSKPLDLFGEIALRSMLITITFILLKMVYLNVT